MSPDSLPDMEHTHVCPNCYAEWECDDENCDPEEEKVCPNCEYEDPMER